MAPGFFGGTPDIVGIDTSLKADAPRAFLRVQRQRAESLGIQLPRASQVGLDTLLRLPLRAANGQLVPLSELVRVEQGVIDKPLFSKDLMPLSYVFGDMAGQLDSSLYGLFAIRNKLADAALPDPDLPAGGRAVQVLPHAPDHHGAHPADHHWRDAGSCPAGCAVHDHLNDRHSGLAVSLIFGILVSTLLTLVVIPVPYYAAYRRQREAA